MSWHGVSLSIAGNKFLLHKLYEANDFFEPGTVTGADYAVKMPLSEKTSKTFYPCKQREAGGLERQKWAIFWETFFFAETGALVTTHQLIGAEVPQKERTKIMSNNSNYFENLNLSFKDNASFEDNEFSDRYEQKLASRNTTRNRQAVRGEKYFVPVMSLEVV